jgi:hypothetical protein
MSSRQLLLRRCFENRMRKLGIGTLPPGALTLFKRFMYEATHEYA